MGTGKTRKLSLVLFVLHTSKYSGTLDDCDRHEEPILTPSCARPRGVAVHPTGARTRTPSVETSR